MSQQGPLDCIDWKIWGFFFHSEMGNHWTILSIEVADDWLMFRTCLYVENRPSKGKIRSMETYEAIIEIHVNSDSDWRCLEVVKWIYFEWKKPMEFADLNWM